MMLSNKRGGVYVDVDSTEAGRHYREVHCGRVSCQDVYKELVLAERRSRVVGTNLEIYYCVKIQTVSVKLYFISVKIFSVIVKLWCRLQVEGDKT